MKKEKDLNKIVINVKDFIIIIIYFLRVVQVYVFVQKKKLRKLCNGWGKVKVGGEKEGYGFIV